jgi:predicted transcriptional regulator
MEGFDIETISFIKSSSYRREILQFLSEKIQTPSDLSKKLKVHFSYVSKILSELLKRNLIKCLNEGSRKSRLYQITELGIKNLNNLKTIEKGN